jgi:hypothetical protein
VEEVTVKQEENNFFCCDLFYSRSLYLQVGWCCRKLLNAMFLCLANPRKMLLSTIPSLHLIIYNNHRAEETGCKSIE